MGLDERLKESMEALTSSERKVAVALLADYPFAGLLTVAELSKRANVSNQTVLRLASKLGFDGYGDFQQTLISEIKEGYHSPVMLRETRGARESGDGFLANLAASTVAAVHETVDLVPDHLLDTVCALLGDPRRSVFLLGGRITGTLAHYLFNHLRIIRPKIHMVPSAAEEWPDHLLRMNRNDLVVMFDFRRYQPDLQLFAEHATRDRKAKILLITDKWISPLGRYSTHILPCIIDADTPWDTSVPAMLLIEAIINKVSERDWPSTRERIETWDGFRVLRDMPHFSEGEE